jgi:hypothetical protein
MVKVVSIPRDVKGNFFARLLFVAELATAVLL